jgi:RNA polymerase sigma-70 factor (ECF subfamily)
MAVRLLSFPSAPLAHPTPCFVREERREGGRVRARGQRADVVDPAWAAADDHALVRECLSGRRGAFDVLVERHRHHVYRLCYRFSGNHEDASDLAQEVFIRAYRALGGFKGQSAVATWLYRIAVNLCLNRVSSRQPPLERLEAREHMDQRGEAAETALLREERAAEVRAAIARLPKKQRATLVLRIYHELSHDDIAGILGSSVGAVKANFFHALANLKKILMDRSR